jgi:threonine/homoserine/homoserine lactone efflux protein
MTITPSELALYAGALFILFLTPGPVWLALTARTLAGGFHAAWPLALGVVVGDALWPFVAILGVTWVVSVFSGFLAAMKWVAAAVFLVMGGLVLRNASMWAGFLAGIVVILANPKAILFYMGVLPGFFDLTDVTGSDIAAIVAISMAVPLVGNIIFALFVDRARRLLTSPKALRRTNIAAGLMLIAVGLIIPLT